MYASRVLCPLEPTRAPVRRVVRVAATEVGRPSVSSIRRHPWSCRPDPRALIDALGRGIRASCFPLRDLDLISRAGAWEVLAYLERLRSCGIRLDAERMANGYDPLGELLRDSPRCPMLRRYFDALFLDGDPDPIYVARTFRKLVRSYTYKRVVRILAHEHPDENNVRRLIRAEFAELGIERVGRRLVFVPGRDGLEPLSSCDHWRELLFTCNRHAFIRELLEATRTILTNLPDVGGWMDIRDVAQDYLQFFACKNLEHDRQLALGPARPTIFMNELHQYWMEIRETVREDFLANCRGPRDVAELDFRAFSDCMLVFFETGDIRDRWLFWKEYFPELRTSMDFYRSPHKRRADTLWRKLRQSFIERYGPEGEA
jgi:hypothetical protein